MDERLRFVARLLDGEKMAALCREFGISRKTGYKIFHRYKDMRPGGAHGSQPAALSTGQQAAVPDRDADRAAQARASELGRARRSARSCAPASATCRPRPSAPSTPSSIAMAWSSTAASARHKAQGTRSRGRCQPNDLWCADYKGEFMLADQRYCYPLTITDFASRYLLSLRGLGHHPGGLRLHRLRAGVQGVRPAHSHPHRQRRALRQRPALFGLSKLSVWWLRLGIRIERIKPGHPEQNGRHERMHLTLKKEATKPAAQNFLQQQARSMTSSTATTTNGRTRRSSMKYPAELYRPSPRPYRGLERARLSVPRPNHHRHALRAHLHRQAQDQPQHGLRRAKRRHQGGRATKSGWSASCTTTWDSSITRHAGSNRSTNPFEPKVLPMSPV